MPSPGLILAAPSSGSGKTLLTLGLLAHLRRQGVGVVSAKVGPDYIDPAFHRAATGCDCLNLDAWAMRPQTLAGLVSQSSRHAPLVICEGVMGLLDGAATADGQQSGSTADIAALTGWPVVMIIDARGMAASAAAVLCGFAQADPRIQVTGVIFNRVSGDKHRRMIAEACARLCPGIQILGFVPRLESLTVPSRHLGLVQAQEHPDLAGFLDRAADAIGQAVDVAALVQLAQPSHLGDAPFCPPLPPLGQHIAIARDVAFTFAYPALVQGWRQAGAEIRFFSPLNDESPQGDAVYLPGGYPELHAERLAQNSRFMGGLRAMAAAGCPIFGECGGYMVLGRAMTDAKGQAHAMAGLLPLETSFAQRRLHLGYRLARTQTGSILGPAGTLFAGHEFHYATILVEKGQSLFTCSDAMGQDLGAAGLVNGSVAASFFHLIDQRI